MWYFKDKMKRKVVPSKFVRQLPGAVKEAYAQWADYMYEHVPFNMPDSELHSTAHSERVLLYALMMGYQLLPGDATALEVLGHAAIFHDTRRVNEWRDSGHGARAASFYGEFCRAHKELTFHPESTCLMFFHDGDDERGMESINELFADQVERVRLLFQIFKDADGLDRWRLGPRGLNPKYLRTDAAHDLVGFARTLVANTRQPARGNMDW